MNCNELNPFIVVLLGMSRLVVSLRPAAHASSASIRPDLEYLKAVNKAAPPRDPQLLFLLMGQYASANRHAEGAEFLSARLMKYLGIRKDN
jgi:hypothetical protein